MARFKTKPFEIEAFQLGVCPTPHWFFKSPHVRSMKNGTVIEVQSKSGWIEARHGDFIVSGSDELYPVKPSVFHRKYEVINNA